MIQMILFALMGVSVVGMLATGFNDPLSQKFWEDMSEL